MVDKREQDSPRIEVGAGAVEIGFNASYLLDFLRATTEPQVALHFKDAHSAGELRPAGDGAANYKYRYVVMPMRI